MARTISSATARASQAWTPKFNDEGINKLFVNPYGGGYHTHRGVLGGTDPNGVAVGTSVHAGKAGGAVNMFTNPVSFCDNVRPLTLGLDGRSGGAGVISGLPYLNLDLSVRKKLVVRENCSLELSGVFENVMNHLDLANPGLSLQSTSAWAVTKTQGNTPRQIEGGIRANFQPLN